jgi:hypothetical protein
MSQQMPFIGREEEMAHINYLIQNWGSRRIVCLHGTGGIGKTRLLEEICRHIKRNASVAMADIIDFDDRALFLPENLERQIAYRLDEAAFEPYLHSLLDWRKMEAVSVSPAILEQQRQRARETFLQIYNQIAAKRRIILLFDTTDHIEGTDVWLRLTDLLARAHNSLFILAGRNGARLFATLHALLGNDAALIRLLALSPTSGQAYLQKKQELLHITLDPELGEKLLLLAQNRPILLDLAVEWLARAQPDAWLTESTLAELLALSPDALAQRQEVFEVQLLNHLIQVRSHMDRLTLVMSRVYPLDAEMVSVLLTLPADEASALFAEAASFVFVKVLPDGRISLHDEMRRMINQHIWPLQDPTGERRRYESGLTAVYLQNQIANLSLEHAALTLPSKSRPLAPQAELNLFIAREKLERDIWLLKSQLLHHTLYNDFDAGLTAFAQIFDEATHSYRLLFRETLLVQMQEYEPHFSAAQRYAVDSRRINYFFDRGQYEASKEIVNRLLGLPLSTSQRVEMLIQLANLDVRLGNLADGVAHFDEAAQLSAAVSDQEGLMRAINGRGWAHRNQGAFSQAITDYLQAYRLSLQLQNRRETARILNNMSFVNAYKGNRQAAMENGADALKLWQSIGDRREIGISYSTLGEIYRRFAEWNDALLNYNKALAIFENEDMREWISTVRAGRASIYLHRRETDKALVDLDYAAANGPQNLQPRIIHTQAQVQMALGNLENSRILIRHCQELSYRIGAYEYGFRSFADLLDLAWEMGEYAQWPLFLQQAETLFAAHVGEEAYRLRGSSLRKIGDLAMGNGRYDAALQAYQSGLPLIARYEQHEPYKLSAQIKVTHERIARCSSPELVNRLGHDLAEFWLSQPDLFEKTPEALITFFAWQQHKKP